MPNQPQSKLPVEEVAGFPLPGMAIPGKLAFSPDDRLITYLFSPELGLTNQLFAYDPQLDRRQALLQPADRAAKSESLEEVLLRQRLRRREEGVVDYAWAKHAGRLLAPLNGDLYVIDQDGAPARCVLESHGSPLQDPQLSPDGNWVAYVQEDELCLLPAAGGKPRQITHGARRAGVTHGLAEFIAQEEMGRHHGFWWSEDSQWLAFTEVDETRIPVYTIVHQGEEATGPAIHETHRYPFAGQANARVRLGVVSRKGGRPIWMELGPEEDAYLARVDWMPDGSLCAQVENRAQTRLDLLRFDPRSGASTLLVRETSQVWINLHDLFKPLKRGEFIWASERSGFRHLVLYDAQGKLIRPLTQGEWMVDELCGVDEERGMVYFTGTLESPLEKHLYRVPLAGGEPQRITRSAGMHTIVLDHACRRFIDIEESASRPPAVTLRSLADGSLLGALYEGQDARVAALGLLPPEIVSLENRSGVRLYGAIFRPPEEFGRGPYPTIVYAYGGPHVQLVAEHWKLTASMRAQYLRSLGFLVFVLDNRGSARRGLAFEGAIRWDMGHHEVEDQVDGVRWLVSRGLADPQRVGIYGWSYGGYLAEMCLLRAPEVFKVAVAGAPVSGRDGYDTHYTERYMGTPQSNPQGYKDSNVATYVANLRGKLLLVHGLIDENVHFRHTARLINALIRARKRYDLLIFPDERHMPRRLADRVYMEERVRDYFLENL